LKGSAYGLYIVLPDAALFNADIPLRVVRRKKRIGKVGGRGVFTQSTKYSALLLELCVYFPFQSQSLGFDKNHEGDLDETPTTRFCSSSTPPFCML